MFLGFHNYVTFYYKVSYSEKDKAKSNGLKFDFQKKKWYSRYRLNTDDEYETIDFGQNETRICVLFDICDVSINNEHLEHNKDKYLKQMNEEIKIMKEYYEEEQLEDELRQIYRAKKYLL
jgi:Trm5-related predicted tRNA methylase